MPEQEEKPEKAVPKFDLMIGGSAAPAIIAEAIRIIRVRQDLEMADCLELRIANDDLSWTETETLAEGVELEIKLGYERSDPVQVFKGEIARRDCEFPVQGGAVITVVAYDKESRLKRGKHSRTWADMKDSDIVKEIAQEVGLEADVEDTAVTHRFVFQSAQTNLSFIRERAALLDYIVDVDRENAKVTFKKADTAADAVVTLKWGVDLLSYDCRMTTDEQVSKVVVRGWDMAAKEKLEGSADTSKIRYLLNGADKGADLAKELYGEREILVCDRPIFVAEEATALAEATINRRARTYTVGRATCQGDANIDAGVKVTFEGVGERAGGEFYVTRTLHLFEPGIGFTTVIDFCRSTERLTPNDNPPPPDAVEPAEEGPEQPGWVEINIRSDTGESLVGVSYVVTLPNGEQQRGTLDSTQKIRVEGIRDPGEAKIEFTPPDELEVLE